MMLVLNILVCLFKLFSPDPVFVNRLVAFSLGTKQRGRLTVRLRSDTKLSPGFESEF